MDYNKLQNRSILQHVFILKHFKEEKKMKKFASYILLAAMMLSILTGCGGGQANRSEQEGATKTGAIEFTISTDGAIRSTYVERFVELVECKC